MVSSLSKDKVGVTGITKKKAGCPEGMFPGAVTDSFECPVTEAVWENGMFRGERQVLDWPSKV